MYQDIKKIKIKNKLSYFFIIKQHKQGKRRHATFEQAGVKVSLTSATT